MVLETLAWDVGRAFYGTFRDLRPAQRAAVEPILSGRDTLVLAGTGSGKTEAVLAPLVQRYLSIARQAPGCTLLYVTPTRALANDLLRRVEGPLDALGLVAGIRHGERDDLARARAPHLLITTPESLDVLVTKREPALSSVRAVMLDEIHLTYNTQRGFQVAALLKRLERRSGIPLQVVGLSATVANAADIWQFFRPGHDVASVRDEQVKLLDAVIRDVASPQAVVDLLDRLASGSRLKVLVFANSRRECDQLGAMCRGMTAFGPNVFVHHSSLDRDARLAVESAFQQASSALCVATSTLELGIDIGDVDLVVLYGHPGGWEAFLQRVGRGSRRAAKTNVLCLVSPDHGSRFRVTLAYEALLSQIASGRLEREGPLDIYGAAAQQLVSLLVEGRGSFQRAADLADVLSDWPHLPRPSVENILDELARSRYTTRHGFQNRYGAGDELHRLQDLRLIWGNFPARSRDVRLLTAGRPIGTIPATNLLRLAPGTIVRFAGRHWRVQRTLADTVEVEPSAATSGLDITYSGSGAPVSPTIAEEMLRLLESDAQELHVVGDAAAWFRASADAMRPYLGRDRLPVARDSRGYFCYVTFAGRLMNRVIAQWAGLGWYEADDLVLRTVDRLDLSRLPTQPSALEDIAAQAMQLPDDLTVFQSLIPRELLMRELVDEWNKTPVFTRTLNRLRRAIVTNTPIAPLAPLCG